MKSKKLLSLFITLAMIAATVVLPTTAFAETAEVTYRDWDSSSKTLVEKTATATEITSKDSLTLEDDGWYYVEGNNVEVDSRITLAENGTAHIILKDGAYFFVTEGIEVNEGQSLFIYGQASGTGTLTTYYGGTGAAIGGDGTVTINGGTVTADSHGYGGGIDGRTVTINGGTVTATNSKDGPGIGGEKVTINGGTVTAYISDGRLGAGIGGGGNCAGGTITINGGKVTATGGPDGGAGIGNGSRYDGDCGATVIINGGTVTATGGGEENGGAGIGGGAINNDGVDSGTVTINGGIVTATGVCGAAGIGGGYFSDGTGVAGAKVTINGGAVTATGSNGAPGIGGGANCEEDYHGELSIDETTMAIKAGENEGSAVETTLEAYCENRSMYISVMPAPKTVDGITYSAWIKDDSLPTEGDWYLTKDVTLPNGWEFTDYVNLDLNGKVVDCNGSHIWIDDNVKVSFYDYNKTTEHKFDDSEHCWKLDEEGNRKVLGGVITNAGGTDSDHCTDASKGCIYVYYGQFNMYGGTLCGNCVENGGGVYLNDGNTQVFEMYGGLICGNAAKENGAGVYVGDKCYFNMYGGTIYENFGNNSGAVYCNGRSTMTGGEIIGNRCNSQGWGAGVYICDSQYLKVGKKAVIRGNYREFLPKAVLNDVALETMWSQVYVMLDDDEPQDGMKIGLAGIKDEDAPYGKECNIYNYNPIKEGYEKYFSADNPEMKVIYSDGELVLTDDNYTVTGAAESGFEGKPETSVQAKKNNDKTAATMRFIWGIGFEPEYAPKTLGAFLFNFDMTKSAKIDDTIDASGLASTPFFFADITGITDFNQTYYAVPIVDGKAYFTENAKIGSTVEAADIDKEAE